MVAVKTPGNGSGLSHGTPQGSSPSCLQRQPREAEPEATGGPVLRRVIIKELLERQETKRRLSDLRKEPIGA